MSKFIISTDGTVVDENGKIVFQSSVSSQEHAREIVHETIADKGYKIDEEWEMDDDTIELTFNT